ncbi:2-oxo-hepta-3-ene-1,7-dioic acid hydratase [Streptomyces sp. NL15-2K]|nr:2-oxo-hepta-3-ene-1,7-dioic acid hydratase [Streptomyces sp. NL15-2K]
MAATGDHIAHPAAQPYHPDMEISDAYAIQQVWAAKGVAAGARLVGHKMGLTSRAMQLD